MLRLNFAGPVCSKSVRHRLDFDPPNEAGFYVEFGWEGPLGYWAELRDPGRRRPVAEYGAIYAGYRHDAPLEGLLLWCVAIGVLDATGLDEALLAWASPEPVRLGKRGQAALDVIEILKREAD